VSAEVQSTGTDTQDVFASGAYWKEYYSSLGHENREVGEFLSEATMSLTEPRRLKILDAGCGPTLLYWAVFAAGSNEVHGFDISPINVQRSRACVDAALDGKFENGLLEAAAHAVQALRLAVTSEHHLVAKARQVATITVADLSRRWPYETGHFDMVQSCFAFENLPDWQSFDTALAEACRVLRPGGLLALANGAYGSSWICDKRHFPTLFITAEVITTKIRRSRLQGRTMRGIASNDADWRTQGYSKVLLTSATKQTVQVKPGLESPRS
jgi:SAM-dependent methyltransferase